MSNTDCRGPDSLELVQGKCQGEQSCRVDATGRHFGEDPCVGTAKYLEVYYNCSALCPLGFNFHMGDVSGWGSISGQSKFEDQSLTDCEGLCGSQTECCSFEWSQTSRTCNLNKECKPTGAKYQDYRFCQKNSK